MTTQDLETPPGALPPPEPLRAAGTALFLDLDGTLAPLEPRPDQVVAEPDRTRLLERLGARLEGRLAVVSGRSIDDLDRILDGSVRALAGVHGLQRRSSAGVFTQAATAAQFAPVWRELARDLPQADGVLLEDKGIAAALHYRQAPHCAAAVMELAQAAAARHGLHLQPGDMVVELRPPGCDKGDAITAFMAEPPFAGATPIFVGDDLTDENGFRAVAALGGYGVLAGPPRKTLATRRLGGVAEVLLWLEQAVSG